ncbi:hypothetical protein L7F22_058899 [Adiantum nelumboides]|nr:hypothetical protein [Adiantum nelumboides]
MAGRPESSVSRCRQMMAACSMLALLLMGHVAAEGSYSRPATITNQSQQKVVLLCLDEDVELGPITVEVGVSVEVPAGLYCFERAGRQSAPVELLVVSLVAIVDHHGNDIKGHGKGKGKGLLTVDVCLAVDVQGVLQLDVTLVSGL